MDIKPLKVFVDSSYKQDHKPIDWLDNKFIYVKDLFPNWITAETRLTDFVQKTEHFLIVSYDRTVMTGLRFPMVRDEISGLMVPMIETFPIEYRDIIEEICLEVMNDYTPDLDSFMGNIVNNSTLYSIKNIIMRRWKLIKCLRGRSINEELGFRLGLFNMKLKELYIEVEG